MSGKRGHSLMLVHVANIDFGVQPFLERQDHFGNQQGMSADVEKAVPAAKVAVLQHRTEYIENQPFHGIHVCMRVDWRGGACRELCAQGRFVGLAVHGKRHVVQFDVAPRSHVIGQMRSYVFPDRLDNL
ncbi:hypothetical protein LMG29542_08452 [Paraburkholderia humisilvae]|uniref:Uncharacterized protein n=1 Tax=Paraburkholderia humisilvae TaxID=627669 RepID=A0A6J5F8A2_9BURK|nr:hypothetical protein LMG29542_08452 [Paraburkholderia humisilvae]